MKWLLVFIFSLSVFGQDKSSTSLKNIQDLEKKLPDYHWIDVMDEGDKTYTPPRFQPPRRYVTYEELKKSPTRKIIVKEKSALLRMEDGKFFYTTKNALAVSYILNDEAEYVYLLDEKNYFFYKVSLDRVIPVGDVVKIFEPPKVYREYKKEPATKYDNYTPRFFPELLMSSGVTQSFFMKDLFEDQRAQTTFYLRYGGAVFVDFKKFIKTGATVQYERSLHYLKDHHRAQFSSLSFGPIVRTPKFNEDDWPWQLSFQLRLAPNSTLTTDVSGQSDRIVMNVTAAQISFEHPEKNAWGELIWGVGFQRQWINLRRQKTFVHLDSKSTQNDQFGVTLSQSFF